MNAVEYAEKEQFSEVYARVEAAYSQAVAEMRSKLSDMLREFDEQNAEWKANVSSGIATDAQYQAWLRDQALAIAVTRDQIESLSEDLANAAKIAEGVVNGETAGAYAEGHAWATFDVESGMAVSTSYTLYNRDAVSRLIAAGEVAIPTASVNWAKELRWDMQHITSAITQGILQGESIPRISDRLSDVAGMSQASAMRMARTVMTGAVNAGTLDGYRRAEDLGIAVGKQWLATLDDRTRHSHRWIDGEVRGLDEAFSNDLQYPGDPDGPASEVYNCRCTTIAYLPDSPYDDAERWSRLGEESYEEWKAGRA